MIYVDRHNFTKGREKKNVAFFLDVQYIVCMEETPQPPHGSGLIIARENSKGTTVFLILKARWGNHWSFPKGHMNKKESPLVCAIRETMEETGISQEDIQILSGGPINISYRLTQKTKKVQDGVKRVRLFPAVVKRKVVVALSREHTSYKWATRKDCSILLRQELYEALDSVPDLLQEGL